MPSSHPLPPKENALFKRILKCYEQKQYKNGLKFAKSILSNPKFADHGETLAMKGLTLSCMGKKEEAYDHVKRGLRNDLQSHVCWHVFGLLQRSDRKYDEAIKCYRNALKWDKDNLQILKDLSLLQIQMRDLDGYKDTRLQLLNLRPAQKASWIGYAMAFHLLHDYDMAQQVLEEFRKTQQPQEFDVEHSELLMYQAQVMSEGGRKKEALDHLATYDKLIHDRLSFSETKAALLLSVENADDSAKLYRDLIDRNPENKAYYAGLEKALRLETPEQRLEMCESILAKHPRATVAKRLPLNFTSGGTFRSLVDSYLRKGINKCVPPLFVSLRELYSNQQRVEIIEELMLSYVENLKENERFSSVESDPKEAPTSLLWSYFYLAQHFDFRGQYQRALEYVELAWKHTVTLIELQVVKARIYKHAGDVDEAVRCMDEAQSLDTADRYINSKCAKYLLRANRVKEAEEMCAKFTRDGVSAMENLNEMQCMWFQTECALSYQRMGRYGDALKQCHEIDRHFTEVIEDQFDFHTYCMRKMTLRAYVGLLLLEDQLRNHHFFFKTAQIACEIYLRLHDSPLGPVDETEKLEQNNLSASELKKLRNKQRKRQKQEAQRKAREDEERKKSEAQKPAKKEDQDQEGPKEEELVPEKLARPDNPLEEALRFLRPLQLYAAKRIETHILAYHIYSRRDKFLLMLQAVKRGHAIDRDNPAFHECLVRFLHKVVNADTSSQDNSLTEVLNTEVDRLYDNRDPWSLNQAYLDRHSNSLPHRLAGARMLYFLDNKEQENALSIATDLSPDLQQRTVKVCTSVLASLEMGEMGEAESAIQTYKAACHVIFPLASVFKPAAMATTNHEESAEKDAELTNNKPTECHVNGVGDSNYIVN